MPILWKVLLKNYFGAFFLGFFLFVFLSLVGNIQSILSIVNFGSEYQSIFLIYLSTLLEISGMCFGFCSLLGSFYTTSQLSLCGQMVFLLPFGVRSKDIQKPLLQISLLLSLTSFLCLSEILPYVKMRLLSSNKESIVSPLTLLSNYKLGGFYESFVDMDLHKNGKVANNFLLIQNNTLLNGLFLFRAKEVSLEPEGLIHAYYATSICHPPDTPSSQNISIIENIESTSFHLQEIMPISSSTNKGIRSSNLLPLSMLPSIDPLSAGIELLRRLSLALFPFTFTLIGGSLGQRCSTKSIKASAFLLIALFFLCCIFLQSTNTTAPFYWKIVLYTAPHIFMWYLAKINSTLFENPSISS
jgi:lipopolysaccharide export LptBFGC system permease protein LptF